jgi:hypothetical protein
MCIVIDADCLSRVFRADNAEHHLFKPVLDWILDGPGIIVYGGTEYLKQAKSFISLFSELARHRKVHAEKRNVVDEREKWVRAKVQDKDFDDQHIVAILLETECRLVCTVDKRSHKFLTHRAFFPQVRSRPRVYGGPGDVAKLCNRNIPDRFKPCRLLSGAVKRKLALNGVVEGR